MQHPLASIILTCIWKSRINFTTTKVGFGNGQNCYDSKRKRCYRSIAPIFQPLPLMGLALGVPQYFPILRQQFLQLLHKVTETVAICLAIATLLNRYYGNVSFIYGNRLNRYYATYIFHLL